jgi:hypothetical protein
VVEVNTIRNGSTNIFLAPLPAELLHLPVPAPDSLDVYVNGVPSACTNPAGYGNCTFSHSKAYTPIITDVTPLVLEFETDSRVQLDITGQGFNSDVTGNRVMLDQRECNITLATSTKIECEIGDDTPGGDRELTVYVDNLGYAAPNNYTVQVKTAYILDVSPKVLHASRSADVASGTVVHIKGKVGAVTQSLSL